MAQYRPQERLIRSLKKAESDHPPKTDERQNIQRIRELEDSTSGGGMVSALGLEPRTYRLKV